MNTACECQCHDAGLWSLINKVMVCFSIYERVHVDFSKGIRCLYCTEGNLWNHLFRETTRPAGEVDEILYYPDTTITGREVAALYGTTEWRQKYHEQWQKALVRPEHIISASGFVLRHWQGRDVVSVLVRATGHAAEQASDKSQPLEAYADAFERIRKPDSILHVMACDQQTVEWFRERYEHVTFYPHTRRTASRDFDCNMNGQQTVEDARHCLIEVLILARSRALIHPVSNMSTGALYINPQMEAIFLP